MEVRNEYWAGFFDAEGSLGISNELDLDIRVGNSYFEVIELLEKAYSGGLNIFTGEGRLPYLTWNCFTTSKEAFLKAIAPYCFIKKAQVDLSLDFMGLYSKPHGHDIPEEDYINRFAYKVKLRALKEVSDPPIWVLPLESKIPYYAGLLDGDGSIRTDYTSPTVEIGGKPQHVKKLFDILVQDFGGVSGTEVNFFRWHLYGNKALKFIEAIEPHLTVKRQKAQLILAFYKVRPLIGQGHRYKDLEDYTLNIF